MKTNTINKITFSSILLGINILFIIINIYLPISILILIGIPLSTTLTKIKCGNKYTFLTILCSVIITSLIDFQTSIFYLLPSLLNGFLFGIFINKKIHSYYIIIFTSLIGITIQFLSFLLIKIIYQINITTLLTSLLNISSSKINNISLTTLFIISFIQTFFSFVIIENEADKFKITINQKDELFYHLLIQTILLSLTGWLLNNILPNIAYLLTTLSIISSTNIIYYLIKYKSKLINIVLTTSLIITYFICLIFSSYFKTNGYHLLFNIFSLTSFINGVILIIYAKLIKKEKLDDFAFNKNLTKDTY